MKYVGVLNIKFKFDVNVLMLVNCFFNVNESVINIKMRNIDIIVKIGVFCEGFNFCLINE